MLAMFHVSIGAGVYDLDTSDPGSVKMIHNFTKLVRAVDPKLLVGSASVQSTA